MKTKYLLTALALPALFAACSQEDIVTNAPQGSTEVLGRIAGDVAFTFGPESRLTWGATDAPAWETNDEFSLFWVNQNFDAATDGTVLNGMANALYKKDGSIFTSENILYEGKHLMVYPVDKAHLGNKAIVVKVDSVQDGSIAMGKRSIYVNDSLLNIKAPLADASKQSADTIYAAGYKQPVTASVKALSSNLVLNLNFDMPSTISEVTVKSVSLVADKEIFPAEGNLTAKGDSVGFKGTKFAKEIKLNMPANTKVTKNAGSYTAQIALLPILTNDATKYQIKVATNYGVVTIDSAKYVTDKNGLYLSNGNTTDNQKAEGFKIGNAALNLAAEFALTKENGPAYSYRGKEYKDLTVVQQSHGKRITANVKVMMNEASISNMKVANSQELIDAYTTYTLLAKTDAENFILSNEKPFELTPEAVAAILANKKVTLTQEGNDTIKLTGAHTAIPSFVTKDATMFDASETKLMLGEGTWAIDVDAAAAVNTWAEVINAGTLTISESNPTEGAVALATPITNWATASFSGNVDMPVTYKQTKEGTTTVPATSYVNLNKGGNIDGNVTVNGGLYANKGIVNVAKTAAVEVYGSFLTASTGTMHNLGTITLKENGTTIVSTNESGEDMGSIVLAKRNSSAKVNDDAAQGYIKWTCDDNTYEKMISDAFNTLILTQDFYSNTYDWGTNQTGGSSIKYIEIAGTKVNIYTNTNLEWAVSLTNVVVNEGSTLVVPKGTSITATGKTVNDGRIEVFGKYVAGTESGKGTIYYYNGQINVTDKTSFLAAMADSKNKIIVLTEDVELTELLTLNRDVTIDLNGKTLSREAWISNDGTSAKPAIYVKGEHTVVITGGTVEASLPVWAADNSNVTIKNGNFKALAYDGKVSPAVYATSGATVTIEDGEFESEIDQKFLLNLQDNTNSNIIVKGGTFKNFNPAVTASENPVVNFVAANFEVKVYQGSTEVTNQKPSTSPYNQWTYAGQACQPDWVADYVYKVVPVTTTTSNN